MKRRRLIAIISLCTLAAIGLMAAVGVVVLMRTDVPRSFVEQLLASRIHGTIHIGRISGNPLSALTVDSVIVRDTTGEIVFSSGKVQFDYDIRDIMDSRVHLRHVTMDHPHMHLRDFGHGQWNYMMMKSNGPSPVKTNAARTWGSYIVFDSLRVTNASFFLSLLWEPDDTLRGAVRDSVIRATLRRNDHNTYRNSRTTSGFARTYMWTQANALVSHVRLADPDSDKYGQEFHIASLDVSEFDPPFKFRNVRGVARRLGDSLWFNLPHFDLPASTGSGSGKLVWGSDRPMRYDVVVRGDSVALKDINWIYATLPVTGGGTMVLRITNKRNDRVMDYHIDSMNVKSTGSHLIGEMTFGVGGGLPLQLRNVNLRADPVDFKLIETLSGKPLPVPWAGQIFGDVRAPGGLVTDFDVTSVRGEWRDARVPGAVSRFSGSGGLDIEFPAFAAFHGFDLNLQTLDLRSIQSLFPEFPKLNGTLAGHATLDSVWTDVRFSDADITHRDGPGTPSRFTGAGRVTDGSPFITYDVDLNADPLSFDMLRRSFPKLTLRGLAYGPLKIKGQSPDLQIAANLISVSGRLRFAGNIDLDSLGGYGIRAVGEFADVDLARLGVRDSAPQTKLSGRYDLDVRGKTMGTLTGAAAIRLAQSTYSGLTLDSTSKATLRFNEGRVTTTDTAVIQSPFGRVTAVGGLGLPGTSNNDSIAVTLVVDSLGKLMPFFTADGKPVVGDSSHGVVTVNGYARGRLDSLALTGAIAGDRLFIRGLGIDSLKGTFTLNDILRAPSGRVDGNLFSAKLGGLEFDSVAARINVIDSASSSFAITGNTERGDSLRLTSTGMWTRAAGATTARLESFTLGFGATRWKLEQPVTVVSDATTVRIDTLVLRSARGASISLKGDAPVTGAIDMRFAANGVPLSDLDRVIGGLHAPVSGVANLTARMEGTRDAPVITGQTSLDSIRLSNVGIGRLTGSVRYADNAAFANADIFQADKRVFHGVADSLPLAIRWLSYDTLPGRVRVSATADSADFTLIQAFVEDISNVTGKISGSLGIDGTWRRPNLVAEATLNEGGLRIDTLGIALEKMFGHVKLENDTLKVNGVRANSGGPANTANLTGSVFFRDWTLHGFDLAMTMNDFLAYDRPELATVYARTTPGQPVTLTGTLGGHLSDTLKGVVYVDRGAIYLPDPKIALKRFSALDSLGFLLVPTQKSLLDRITDSLETNILAHIGGAFKLSADYADIPLSGDLTIVPVAATDVARRSTDFTSRIAPVGTITTDVGSYDLYFTGVPFFSKRFVVQRGGTVTFDRDAQWNGLLNVSAKYVVRKPGKPEVPIAIDVTDRLLSPRVTPRSEAEFFISQSDLISYIIFDQPGLLSDFGQQNGSRVTSVAASIFAPIATTATSEYLRKQFFSRLDQFQLQTTADTGFSGINLLSATRLTGGKAFEVGGRPFFASLSAGLCSVDTKYREANSVAGRGFVQQLGQQVGGSVEYRLKSSLTSGASWQMSLEPPSDQLLCGSSYNAATLGVAQTPRQLSLSYLKFWRW
jgi:translocation and assembly module TamB